MKRDRRGVLDLISEQEEQLTFDMFQTPDELIRQRLPDKMKIKCTSPQGSALLKMLNKAAIMDHDTYYDLYLKVQNEVTGGGATADTDISADFNLTKDETITLLNMIKLTDAKLINPRLNIRDLMWQLRLDILNQIGIEEVN